MPQHTEMQQCYDFCQQVLNLTPLNPTPATFHKRKRKLRCSFRSAALQKLHCNIGFSCLQFWGRKWVRQFYGHLEKCVLSAGKTMSVKFPFFGGGGGSADFIFMGARIFLRFLGERQSIAQKGVRAIDARNSAPRNGSNATKTSVRAPGLSANECEHPFV